MTTPPWLVKFLSMLAEAGIQILGSVFSRLAIDVLKSKNLLPHLREQSDTTSLFERQDGALLPRPRPPRSRTMEMVSEASSAAVDAAAPIAADAIVEPVERKLDHAITENEREQEAREEAAEARAIARNYAKAPVRRRRPNSKKKRR